jgi:localization factor PodJL
MRKRIVKQLKTLSIAVSVVIIVLGTLQTAMDYFLAPEQSEAQSTLGEDPAPDAPPAPATAPAAGPSRPMPTPDGLPPAQPEPDTTQSINRTSSIFDPSTVLSAKQPPASADVTGSIARQTPSQRQAPATADPAVNALPASFGPMLRAAAAGGDPSAEHEIALRYAESRGVPRNMDEAVRWLGRAAKTGFAPAQFRLAGIHEKGDGVKKDLATARALYIAAAEKGHAKAMHNLAVLYAEGIDGKPDYRVAAQWFRRAAAHGVADSQFNLAILYARGIGIEQNLAESYKWFALAAGSGDQDAAKKRDEVAGRLDQQTMMAAKLAMQTFTPQREPEEATSVKVPPGGWDRTTAAAQPAKSKSRPRTPAAP